MKPRAPRTGRFTQARLARGARCGFALPRFKPGWRFDTEPPRAPRTGRSTRARLARWARCGFALPRFKPCWRSYTVLAIAVAILGGCGYSFRGTLPAHLKTVAVPVLVNRTGEPAVENLLTRAIVEAFSTNGRLRVVDPGDADAILEGEVVGYQIQSVAFDSRANVRQYRLIVTMNLKLRDVRRETVLFQQQGLQERADFRVVGAVSETISREETALRAAAIDIARAVVSLAVERF